MEEQPGQDSVARPSLAPRSVSESPVAYSRTKEQGNFGQGAFLLKKMEVSIESAPAEPMKDDQCSDRASTSSTTRGDEIRTSRSLIGKPGRQSGDSSSSWRSCEDLAQTYDAIPFGMTVSIEAAQPVKAREQQLHELKGLQQAASMKRWAGEGRPAEVWGKLIKVGGMMLVSEFLCIKN